ncbi:GCN5-related N-acetyltransferase [Thermoanaerobacter mathranii subsp. mathranii str. A3]|uniref:Acetyltransferase, ribosomal protein N-acetylase n=2 Tax=Thermoanaerobacter TaxID=1754 RepID=I8R0P3_9THEO|nr:MULTISPECIES: GNAT family protein [Thermoanaerobacter]ABY93105.1 GCN5-related N-acetyltransferase [Thermoanaerobacter sp. X514]ADH61106.1 GCN5-related N-acetyltransferase [Thermoanaerobacter mathranii subsp. mathranii str. A3]EIW01008.1 acetyltransferase, ribosomal protein N-acetylase [Thermoanaerobacter siderophilus SR4]
MEKFYQPVLETPRLILKKISLEDAEDMFEYARDPEVTKYVSWEYHKSIEDSVKFINLLLSKYANSEPSDWGLYLKENGKLIGTCGYVFIDEKNMTGEIGYVLGKKYWNKGFMTEAVKKVIEFGFKKLNLNRIQARCKVENIPSERVMQKVGMKFEGILRETVFIKGRFWDMKMYSILKREYELNN